MAKKDQRADIQRQIRREQEKLQFDRKKGGKNSKRVPLAAK